MTSISRNMFHILSQGVMEIEKYIIGIDIGTQGTKTSLFTIDGKMISEAFEASRLISSTPGVVEQDMDEIYDSVLNTIRDTILKSGVSPNDVSAIGLDGQMAGILGIDKDWNAVTPYDSWLDTRCGKYIDRIKQEAEDKVIQTTGSPVTYTHGPKILWWKYERPEVYAKINKFILPTTYVAGRLTGLKAEYAYIDYTHLHFSGYGDVLNKKWSEELLGIFGVDKGKMPEIVEPWKIVGTLTKEAAAKCGLICGIPVAAGCGDQAATSLGAGVTRKGVIFDVSGTASVFSCCVDQYSPDVKNKTLVFPRSVLPDLWIPLAYISGGGLCLKWLKDQLTWKGNQPSFNELDEEAAKVSPGSEGLFFIPHFGGRTCPNNPTTRGSWIGLNWVHTRSHMYRAVMEAIAYEYSLYLKIIEELAGELEFSNVIAIGGGSKSKVFNSIKADVLGIPYSTLIRGDTATLGSAVVAGYGVKIYDEIKPAIDNMIEKQNEMQPDLKNHRIYQKYVNIYSDLFDSLEDAFRKVGMKENDECGETKE